MGMGPLISYRFLLVRSKRRKREAGTLGSRSGGAEPELCFIDMHTSGRCHEVDVGSRRVRLRRSVHEVLEKGKEFVPVCKCVSLVVSCERAFENWLKEKQLLKVFRLFLVFLYSRHKPTSV